MATQKSDKKGQPLMTGKQYGKFTETLNEMRHPELIEERVMRETAKQIFKELDEYVYVTGLSVKDKKADWFKEKYEALKKRFKVD